MEIQSEFIGFCRSVLPMNAAQPEEFNYGVYTRKSSEYEDSQVQSIQRQIDDLADLIDRERLVIHREFLRESQSAFHPGREEFAKLVRWTNDGHINAWLCWHANRLSRNPIDAGAIIYLLDQGKLHHIRTRERIYYNTPTDKFMLQMEFTMSKKDSDDKSALVKSGIQRRHRRGYPNGYPPTGYVLRGQMGQSGQSFWVVDSKNFKLVRKVLTRFLEGTYSLSSIHSFAQKIGLSTTSRRVSGGRPLSRSGLYQTILKNPIYAGYFYGSDGQRYTLDQTLQRAITEEEFTRIQEILGERNQNPWRKGKRQAAFQTLIACPAGRILGADFKFQLICDCKKKFAYRHKEVCPACQREISRLKKPTYLAYTYYYSVQDRKRKGVSSKSVEEKVVSNFIIENLARKIAISRPLRDWAVKYLKELRDEELRDRSKEARLIEEATRAHVSKRKRLRDLYVKEQITEKEYLEDLKEIDSQFEKKEREFSFRSDWFEDASKALDLAVELESIMRHGSPSNKFQALKHLGSNLTWDGKKLSITNTKAVNVLIEALKKAKAENVGFEPEKCVDIKGKNGLFKAVRPVLCRELNKVRT